MKIVFQKSGQEIKEAIQNRKKELEARLENRNLVLNEFLKDLPKVRSYMIRSSEIYWASHGGRPAVLYGKDDISSEEREEIAKICQRVFEIEQEIRRLDLMSTHLSDSAVFDLSLEELMAYGFESNIKSE